MDDISAAVVMAKDRSPLIHHGGGRRLFDCIRRVCAEILPEDCAWHAGAPTPAARGPVMTLWFALFVLQTQLVAMRLPTSHQHLGVAGVLLAIGVVVVGVATPTARREALCSTARARHRSRFLRFPSATWSCLPLW